MSIQRKRFAFLIIGIVIILVIVWQDIYGFHSDPESIFGEYKEGVYHNSFLGFSLEVPMDYDIIDNETMLSNNSKIKEANMNERMLFALNKKENTNETLIIYAERLNIIDRISHENYIKNIKSQLKDTFIDIDITESSYHEIDGLKVVVLQTQLGEYFQKRYIIYSNGFAIQFWLGETEKEISRLDGIMSTLQFH